MASYYIKDLKRILVIKNFLSEWIAITQDKAFFVIAGTRIIKELIMLPIQVATIYFLEKLLNPTIRKFLKKEEVK